MCAKTNAQSRYGQWGRDPLGLPCFHVDPATLPAHGLAARHWLSTGRLGVAADHIGRVELFAGGSFFPLALNGHSEGAHSAFYVSLTSQGVRRTLAGCGPGAEINAVRWGACDVIYDGRLEVPGATVRTCVELVAPWDAPFVVCVVRLAVDGDKPLEVEAEIVSDLAPVGAEWSPAAAHSFCRGGSAMFTDVAEPIGDCFLAGDPEWTAETRLNSLLLRRTVALQPGQSLENSFIVGCRHDCSVNWLTQHRTEHRADGIRERWKQRLAPLRLRAPERWMQEECVWSGARLYAFRTPAPDGDGFVVAPLARRRTGSAYGHGGATAAATPPLRDLLMLSLPLACFEPDIARRNLLAVTAHQTGTGRLTAQARHTADLTAEPSDLEIWLLAGWTHYAHVMSAADSAGEPQQTLRHPLQDVWPRLLRTYDWLETSRCAGARGLPSCGNRDTNPMLNRCGVAGRGESVLNGALLAYALGHLAGIARERREPQAVCDRLASGHRDLLRALGRTFDRKWFIRAYADEGRALGDLADDRIFPDVQAWAVLAKAGTTDERQTALTSLRERCGDGPVLPTVAPPYAVPPPPHVSSERRLPGEGFNGGFSAAVAAWLVWALAEEGRIEDALHEWTRLAGRHVEQTLDLLPGGPTDADGCVCSHLAGPRAGAPGVDIAEVPSPYPSPHLTAWQHFAMSKILTPPAAS